MKSRNCSYCSEVVFIKHKHRLNYENVFCNKKCESLFRTAAPNTRCYICGKPIHIKPYRIDRAVEGKVCCSKTCLSIKKRKDYLDSNNPNSIHNYDFSDIYNITHNGAYILGLIYSGGHLRDNGSISISQNMMSAGYLLHNISTIFVGNDSLVTPGTNGTPDTLTINSKELVNFVCNLGGINVGKKSNTVDLPSIPPDKVWSFVCGYFDGEGGFKYDYKYPEISITSNSAKMLESISKVWKVNYTGQNAIYASGNKALDICGKMYRHVSLHHRKKYEYFIDILNWHPLPKGCWYRNEVFKYKKLSPEAKAPEKERVTDSGYDVYAVEMKYDIRTDLYIADTKLAVEPPPGWYFDLVGRSSLPKSGFMFAGGVGIIDRSYVGPLKMLLKKINTIATEPDLPFKLAQLVPRRIIHADFIEVEELGDSDRGEDSFGSTGK